MTAVYLVAPVVGVIIGVSFGWILKGPPTNEGTKAARGEVGGPPAAAAR
jgi:hypothetical protein